jgi:hypothetical protein
LLRREPVSLETWPAWRPRLREWIEDRSRRADPAFDAASTFMKSQSDAAGELPRPLADDSLAWYLLGRAHLLEGHQGDKRRAAEAAERDCRKCIELDPQFARGHRSLALALLVQSHPLDTQSPRAQEAQQEMQRARELDPQLKFKSLQAFAAAWHDNFPRAEKLYAEAVAEDPEDIGHALSLAATVVRNQQHAGSRAAAIAPLVAQHRDDGTLLCFYALALAIDNDAKGAVEQLRRARELGVDPAEVFDPKLIEAIEEAARPGPIEILKWSAMCFFIAYSAVMAVMALAGVILGSFTRGTGVLRLLPVEPLEVVSGGQVVRTASEPWLARLYAVSLVFGPAAFPSNWS